MFTEATDLSCAESMQDLSLNTKSNRLIYLFKFFFFLSIYLFTLPIGGKYGTALRRLEYSYMRLEYSLIQERDGNRRMNWARCMVPSPY